jgi:hypothetical protein
LEKGCDIVRDPDKEPKGYQNEHPEDDEWEEKGQARYHKNFSSF